MTAGELSRRIGGTLIAANADNEISRGMVCDMLSHAMAHGKAGCAWITVQTHMTAVAIATQCSMACKYGRTASPRICSAHKGRSMKA